MMVRVVYLTLALLLWIDVGFGNPLIYEKQYSGFKVWLDCDHHGPAMVYYELGKDEGNVKRSESDFKIDPSIPAECEYKSGAAFGSGYDRGHLVPANHLDFSEKAMEESFYITNMLPQEEYFNRYGAWRQTENITECYRELGKLEIWAGVVYGDNKDNDLFVKDHGIETPDFWWKVIYRVDKNSYDAWYMPNDKSAKKSNLEDFRLSISELKLRLPYELNTNFTDAKFVTMPVSGNSRRLKCEGITTSGG